MIIDTRTIDGMKKSLLAYLNKDLDVLEGCIRYAERHAKQVRHGFNTDEFQSEILRIFSTFNPQKTINEIYLYHLSRRLEDENGNFTSRNLKSLLLGDSVISDFLKKHEVAFVESEGHPILFYRGSEVELTNSNKDGASYLKGRLGYFCGEEDYCINGFAFRDCLMKNSYTRELYDCPEFINMLSQFLNNSAIKEDYFNHSKYYCITYRLKMEDVLFDEKDWLENDEKINYFLVQLCERILAYMNDPTQRYFFDHDNPILRLADDACLTTNEVIDKEEITLDMIE